MEEIWTTNIGGWTKPPQGLILWTWQTALATALYFHFMHCLSLIALIFNPSVITLAYDDCICPGLPPVHGFAFFPTWPFLPPFNPFPFHYCHLLSWPPTLNELNHSLFFFLLVSTSSRVRSTKVNHATMCDAVIHQQSVIHQWSMLIDTTNTIQCPPGFCKLLN